MTPADRKAGGEGGWDMKIVNMQRINQDKDNLTKAVFDIDFGIMVIPDWKLMSDRKGGLWAVVPRDRTGKMGAVRIKDHKIMEVITQAARDVFDCGKKNGVECEI
jgi:hypothetical protein